MLMYGVRRLACIRRQHLCRTSGRSQKYAFGLVFLHRIDDGGNGRGLSCACITVDHKYIIISSAHKVGHLPQKGILTGSRLMMHMRPE